MNQSIETQTESLAIEELFSAQYLATTKINALFVHIKKESSHDAKRIQEFILELQNISKLLMQMPLELIIDDLRQAVLLADKLDEIIQPLGTKSLNTHILFNTSITIRECYIQSLEITQNYALQRIELLKLLQVYDNFKTQESLRFSQEIKRLIIQKNLNNPLLKDQSLLTRILNQYDTLAIPGTFEQGTQTELTSFNNQEVTKYKALDNSSLELKEELEFLNNKYLGKIHNTPKRKYEVKKAYILLSNKAYELLLAAKKNRQTSSQEYLNLLDDALEIQKFYIEILKQIGFVEHSLYKALQRAAQLFKHYYEAIKTTDLLDEAKEWLLSLMLSLQDQASTIRTKRACDTIINTSCTSFDEKAAAHSIMYTLMCFDGVRISNTTGSLFEKSDLNAILEVLKQASKNIAWLNHVELANMTQTSAYYLNKIFNKIFPATQFHDNWIYALDLHVNSEDFLRDLECYLSTIYKSEYNLSLIKEALNIFHHFKLYEIEKLINTNPDLQSNKFLEFQRFTIAFRKDAYEYLLHFEDNGETFLDFENLLLYSEYSSQFIAMLTAALQEKKRISAPLKIIKNNETKEEPIPSSELNIKKPIVPRKNLKKLKEDTENKTIWDKISIKYNLRQTFNFTPEWEILRIEVKSSTEQANFDGSFTKIDEFLERNIRPDIDTSNIALKYSIFDALCHKLECLSILGNLSSAWDILNNISDYVVSHEYTYLQNAQKQQIATYTAQLYSLESVGLDAKSDEYLKLAENSKEHFTKAHKKAKEINMLCYSALVTQEGIDSLDTHEIMQHWDTLIVHTDDMPPISDYQLFYLLTLFHNIAEKQITSIIPKIDKEHRRSLIENKAYFFTAELFNELKKLLEIVDGLQYFCEHDRYMRLLQARGGFNVYKSLLDIVRNKSFYTKALNYGEIIKEITVNPDEIKSIEHELTNIKLAYKNNHGALVKHSLFARFAAESAASESELKIDDENNPEEIFAIFFSGLQNTIFAKQINNLFITLKKVFHISLLDGDLYAIFVESLSKHLAIMSKDSHLLFLKLDEIYKSAYSQAQKNAEPTSKHLEDRLKLYVHYHRYLSYLQEQSNLGGFFMGLINDLDIPAIHIQQHMLVTQINILQKILKIDSFTFDSNCFIKSYITYNDELFDIFKNIKNNSTNVNISYFERAINANADSHYWAFLLALKEILRARISKPEKISINYLITKILMWGKESLYTDDFAKIFKDKVSQDIFLRIQSALDKTLKSTTKWQLNIAIKAAESSKDRSLNILNATLTAIDTEPDTLENPESYKISL